MLGGPFSVCCRSSFWLGGDGGPWWRRKDETEERDGREGEIYSEIPDDGIEILGGELVTVYLELEEGAPRFIVVVLADITHVVDGLDAQDG